MTALQWGNVPVPNTASWSAEEGLHLGNCPHFAYAGIPALVQRSAQGQGKPLFGSPHSCRQREAMARCLCDICGKSLKTSTKVSLSHARPYPHGAEGWAVLQVEPMMHRTCAAVAIQHCPSLKRDVENGTLMIRQVLRYRVQCAIMSPEYVHGETGQAVKALGHAKIELLRWRDRDMEWLFR